MFINYLKAAFRNLWRNKTISFINILGLSLGFGLFLVIWAYVRYEKDFDTFHKNFDETYILKQKVYFQGKPYESARAAGGFASILKDRYPSVDMTCRLSLPFESVVGGPSENDERQYFIVNKLVAVDSTFFNLFSFKVLSGNKENPLRDPGSIILTKSLADKMFPGMNPVGITLSLDGTYDYLISAVVEDPPVQSSIQFDCLVRFEHLGKMGYPLDGYDGTMFFTYLLMKDPGKENYIDEDFQSYISSIHDPDIERELFIEPFSRVHLFGEEQNYLGVYIYSVIGILILLIACINFINLTTAFALSRSREISIRKMTGAGRRELITQMMTETALIILIAFYIGLIIAEQAIPFFSKVHDQNLGLNLNTFSSWLQLLLIFILTLLISGLYPAIRISAFKAIDFFQSRGQKNGIGNLPRKILVVIQFVFSIMFIITSIYMFRQYNYLQTADLGFLRKNIIYFQTRGNLWNSYPEFRQDLVQQAGIVNVTTASDIPTNVQTGDINWGRHDIKHDRLARIILCDENFAETFDIKMQKGRFYDESFGTDFKEGVVLNPFIADMMDREEILGSDFYLWEHDLKVIGVSEDIRFFPFNLGGVNADALIYKYDNLSNYIFIRLSPGWTKENIKNIEKIFDKFNPGYPFEYSFLEDYKYATLENADSFKLLFLIITSLGILISSFGLFGLSIYTTNRRKKEIGIRKALGSTSQEVYRLLIKNFISLVILANLIAQPLSLLTVRAFSSVFAYKANITPWIFILTFLFTLVLSLLTIGYHALRVARSNPVDSLRYE